MKAERAGVPVTVVIKALNEEDHIAGCVRSALAAVESVGGEVVLADSGSTDRTVEIASAFPIRIVQLADRRERCCGIGPQLGYQHSRGEFVYVLDGDMELDPGFLAHGLAFLAQHPEVAGVGGRLYELNTGSLEFMERSRRDEQHRRPGPVDRLDSGGLYRRRAIEEVGYLSDRNLHSYEELELATRLRARGWKLWRLPHDAAGHHGHDEPALRLLARRWRTRYAWGTGELLRAAWGGPALRLVLRDLRELRLYAGVWAWWIALALATLAPLPWPARAGLLLALLLIPWALMALRKRSLARAAHSLASWCVNGAGIPPGFLRRRTPPAAPIASRVLQELSPGGDAPAPGRPPTPARRPTPPSAQQS